MPRQFTINTIQHQMSLAAIGRIEEAFGKSALEVAIQVEKDWMVTNEEGKAVLMGNKIRLGDAYKFMAAAIGSTPDEVATQIQGISMFNAISDVLSAFSEEVLLLVRGKQDPAVKESIENPSPAADASTSGG